MIRIKVGNQYVQFVTEEKLLLTDRRDDAGCFTWEGQVEAEKMVKYHLTMNEEGL